MLFHRKANQWRAMFKSHTRPKNFYHFSCIENRWYEKQKRLPPPIFMVYNHKHLNIQIHVVGSFFLPRWCTLFCPKRYMYMHIIHFLFFIYFFSSNITILWICVILFFFCSALNESIWKSKKCWKIECLGAFKIAEIPIYTWIIPCISRRLKIPIHTLHNALIDL